MTTLLLEQKVMEPMIAEALTQEKPAKEAPEGTLPALPCNTLSVQRWPCYTFTELLRNSYGPICSDMT